MAKQTTGEFMALLRKANGYTQQEVAEKLNISNRTLSSWETDRTMPDVLVLPAIADLYNVTVDELLRGERITDKTANTISEESRKRARKQRFGKFSIKCALLGGIAVLCESVAIISGALALYTATPLWLIILLAVIGLAGTCVCFILAFYYYNNVKLAEGIVTDDDYAEDNKSFVFALKNKLANITGINVIPFAVASLSFLIAFLIINPQNTTILNVTINVRKAHICVICVNTFLSLILFAAYLCVKLIGYKKTASEAQYARFKSNRKLLGKIAGFGSISIAAVIILNIILALVFPNGCKTLYKSYNYYEFKTNLETLTIAEDDERDVPKGKFYLPLPDEKPQSETEFDFGNGFYGEFIKRGVYIDGKLHTEEYFEITYGNLDEKDSVPCWRLYVYESENNHFVANARYYYYDHWYDDNGNKVRELSFAERNGKYYFLLDISDTLYNVAIYTYTIIPLCAVIVCAAIYAQKRKKQLYTF